MLGTHMLGTIIDAMINLHVDPVVSSQYSYIHLTSNPQSLSEGYEVSSHEQYPGKWKMRLFLKNFRRILMVSPWHHPA